MVARGWCQAHYRRWRKTGNVQADVPLRDGSVTAPIEHRLESMLDKSGDHWMFTGATDRAGYGLIWDSRRGNNSRAHRIAFELWVGPIPDGCDVHHVCETPGCCRPDHLEAKPSFKHNSDHHTKTHCVHGHEYTPENTRQRRGQKVCRTCERDANLRYREANRDRINAKRRDARRSAAGRGDGA